MSSNAQIRMGSSEKGWIVDNLRGLFSDFILCFSTRCIGTTQELKSNYGGGYSLEIKGCIDNNVSVDDTMAK